MTVSSYKKVLKQLKDKPVKMARFLAHNKPKERVHGVEGKRCVRCGNPRGHIAKYGLNLCRRCFRDIATKINFRKFS